LNLFSANQYLNTHSCSWRCKL